MLKNNVQVYVLNITLATTLFYGCEKDGVIQNEEKQDVIITWANPDDIFYGTLLTKAQLNATASVPGTFVYSPSLRSKLDVGANQEIMLVFIPADTLNFNRVKRVVIINVLAKKDPIIMWMNPGDIHYGELLNENQLNATADVPGVLVYTPASGTKLSVGPNKVLKVSFVPTDLASFNPVSKTVQIHVHWEKSNLNSNLQYGTMTDQEGTAYKTITIGSQTWMAENLKTTKYRNGDPITNITSNSAWMSYPNGAYCWFNNDSVTNNIFGALYNWWAVDDSRNIAPQGWHIPTDEEWETLTSYLNGENIAGAKLKEIGTKHWDATNKDATNESGFTALPGGGRGFNNGNFSELGFSCILWSKTQSNSACAWGRYFREGMSNCKPYGSSKQYGFSVRCIKD